MRRKMDNVLQKKYLSSSYKKLIESLNQGHQSIYLHGLSKNSLGYFLANLYNERKETFLLICENNKEEIEVKKSIDSFLKDYTYLYPAMDMHFYQADTDDKDLLAKRIEVQDLLAKEKPIIVVSSLEALKNKISKKEDYLKYQKTLYLGEEYEMGSLLKSLEEMMYERVLKVEHPGQYSLRGGILDVFPIFSLYPVRMEFFDLELDSIRYFDTDSQRSLENIQEISLGPCEQMLFHKEDYQDFLQGIQKDLKAQEGKDLDLIKARDKFSLLIEKIREKIKTNNPHLLTPYLKEDSYAYLMDYLGPKTTLIFLDFEKIYQKAKLNAKRHAEELTYLYEKGEILSQHFDTFLSFEAIVKASSFCQKINISPILKNQDHLPYDILIGIRSLETTNFHGKIGDFLNYLQNKIKRGYISTLFVADKMEEINSLLYENNIKAYPLDQIEELERGKVYLIGESLDKGFEFPEAKLLFLAYQDISGKKEKVKKREKKSTRDFMNYQDLDIGDFVVHESYGIASFEGIQTMDMAGVIQDYLILSYAGSGKLYIPTSEMHLISRYIGKDANKPKLSTLGSKTWAKTKEKVQKAVDAIADDLVILYAKRAKIKGFSFSKDSIFQEEFEEAFPYEETPSQARSIEEIKEDMQSNRPMDRLLCGDVGYGKTEVALRAAFKAVVDGKQVAFLCPTTILTQQHYQTMIERFQDFPVSIDFLSRFKTKAQSNLVVQKLKEGKIDIIVGTHRLLSKDISFKDLGLLIVDEEQRFGVKDKEKIKGLKENVDVLTLTATPIPRTLQMSLTGIRDMSLLDEPPEERIPPTSYVMEYNPVVIQDALQRELDRQGQVYFVYNRVYDIHSMAQQIQEMIPEARIAIAHGRMQTRELENVMESFVLGDSDILLATTIIETGMDIPNVNTLIVYHADRMGLAQLYQLKGRIGRSNRRSFAFFTYERNKILSEISEKRLKAIKDFSDFGSGYKIAMRDLELRGAGNLLGESQSGHIESIGYDLYVKFLEEAVAKAKGEYKERKTSEVKVDIKLPAYIPDHYILQSFDKITMYRKIGQLTNEKEYYQIVDELVDRFGDVPSSVENLLKIALIKALADEVGFSQIKESKGKVELLYSSFDQFSLDFLEKLSKNYSGPLSFDFLEEPKFLIESSDKKLDHLLLLLKTMNKINEKVEKV